MTYVVAINMPKGCRPMTEVEVSRLKWGQMLDVLDTHNGAVAKCHAIADAENGSVTVKFRGGHVTTLGASNVDEQFVAVTVQLAEDADDPVNALALALRLSLDNARLKGRIRLLEEALHRQADTMQGLPTREQYEAVVADISQLQQDYRALRLVRAS